MLISLESRYRGCVTSALRVALVVQFFATRRVDRFSSLGKLADRCCEVEGGGGRGDLSLPTRNEGKKTPPRSGRRSNYAHLTGINISRGRHSSVKRRRGRRALSEPPRSEPPALETKKHVGQLPRCEQCSSHLTCLEYGRGCLRCADGLVTV